MSGAERETIRLDKWIWHARLCRSRSIASRLVADGHVRVNARRVTRPAHAVAPGDVLTLVLGGQVRLLAILGNGQRRGPPAEAAGLYRELAGEGSEDPPDVAAGHLQPPHPRPRP